MIQNMPKASIPISVGGMYQEWSCLMDLVEEDTAKPFELQFACKLNYYVNAVDELLNPDELKEQLLQKESRETKRLMNRSQNN